MQDEQFYRKKQLLARRDEILEEIGQTLFEEGALKGEFSGLEKEFRGIDILLRKLKERDRLFREEREQTSQTLRDILEELGQLDKAHKRTVEPLRHERDEYSLRLGYQPDRTRKQPVPAGQAEMEQRLMQLQEELESLEREYQAKRYQLQSNATPLDRKLHRMDKNLAEIQEEVQGLLTSRQKRLQDLGFWFFKQKSGTDSQSSKCNQLKIVRYELNEFPGGGSHVHFPQMNGPIRSRSKREIPAWGSMALLLVVAFLITFAFRTRYREESVPMTALAQTYLAEEGGFRVGVDFTRQADPGLVTYFPTPLADLPGASQAFKDLTVKDVAQFGLARTKTGEDLLFVGLSFYEPVGLPSALYRDGWTYQLPIQGWKTMAKDTWLWVILDDRSALLIPQSERPALEKLALGTTDVSFYLAQDLVTDDPAGYDHLELRLFDSEFTLSLGTKADPSSWTLKPTLQAGVGTGSSLTLKALDNEIRLNGPRSFLSKLTLTAVFEAVEKVLVKPDPLDPSEAAPTQTPEAEPTP